MSDKISLNYIALYLIIPFSGYYITRLPLSPIYIFILIGAYFSVLIVFFLGRAYIDKIMGLVILFLVYLLVTQLEMTVSNSSAFIAFIFPLVVFLVAYPILNKTSAKVIIYLSEKLIYFSLPLLLYEAYYRITNPIFFIDFVKKGRPELEFYFYKVNSIMYQDSNFVAIFILSLFFFLIYIKQFTNKKYNLTFLLLVVLIFVTLSRATLLSLVICLILYQFRIILYKRRYIVFFASIILIMITMPLLIQYENFDDSFQTKLELWNKSYVYFINAGILDRLFGVGCGNAVDVLNMGAHNFFLTYLVESGLIGLFFIFIIWSAVLIKTKYKAGIVMFPFILNGMSLASPAIPYLYVMFAIILVLEGKKKWRKN